MKLLNILGTVYTLYEDVTKEEDQYLESLAGYTDRSSKKIVIQKPGDDWQLENRDEFVKNTKRHEIIHAYLFESGIDECSFWGKDKDDSHSEQIVEWIAIQFPKLYITFKEAEAL